MASTIANLAVSLTANTQKFQRGMHNAHKQVGTFKKGILSAVGGMKGFIATAAGVGSVGALFWRLNREMGEIVRTVREVRALGDDVSAFTRLRYAASTTGVSAEEFSRAMQVLARRIGETRKLGGEAVKTFRLLGLNLDELAARGPSRAFEQIATALGGIRNQADKAAFAGKLFGEELGARMIPLVDQGAEGLKKLADEAERLGVVLTDEAAIAADRYDDAMNRLSGSMKGVWQDAALRVEPAISGIANAMAEVNKEIEQGENTFAGLWGEVLKRPLSTITEAIVATVADITGGLDSSRIEIPSMFKPSATAAEQLTDAVEESQGAMQSMVDVGEQVESVYERVARQYKTTADEIEHLVNVAEEAMRSTRTVQDEWRDYLADMGKLLERGWITSHLYQEATANRMKELFPGPDVLNWAWKKETTPQARGVESLTSSLLTRIPGSTDWDKQALDVNKRQEALQKEMVGHLKDLKRQKGSDLAELN